MEITLTEGKWAELWLKDGSIWMGTVTRLQPGKVRIQDTMGSLHDFDLKDVERVEDH